MRYVKEKGVGVRTKEKGRDNLINHSCFIVPAYSFILVPCIAMSRLAENCDCECTKRFQNDP